MCFRCMFGGGRRQGTGGSAVQETLGGEFLIVSNLIGICKYIAVGGWVWIDSEVGSGGGIGVDADLRVLFMEGLRPYEARSVFSLHNDMSFVAVN